MFSLKYFLNWTKIPPKSHKIERPLYTSHDDDNIYSYVTAYNAFLKLEGLANHSRTYTPYEIAIYIADDLEKDPHKRFDKGIDHVRLQLQHSNNGIDVPRDISITKIAKIYVNIVLIIKLENIILPHL